ncbi:WD40 repeat [Kalmanozyma brasiliensis GHG001]|uniref:WD40 repeat n=1 Tax=Kalmanozyma brasiliensis (strain GHG001) TaxID=1365824 RepID=UPI002867F532|nr:WD40 repeat [Kalmanozyma brasiliensis GHG001]EST07690.2 WD40 repeat [Kalmanozyma brasiliensis GHG001]
MMFSPPSSPSVLASTSRHNIIQPQQLNQDRRQKSLRLFLGHQSDNEAASDDDFDAFQHAEDDSDSDIDLLSMPRGSSSSRTLQPGRLQPRRSANNNQHSPARAFASLRAYDQDEDALDSLFSPSKGTAKRSRMGKSPRKVASLPAAATTKQQAAASAAIPATPTKRQKGFLIQGNVTPSRAFSIFKAAKQRSQQRQQHGLMTPPTSSPLRPIILNSFDQGYRHVEASPSRCRAAYACSQQLSSSPSRSSNDQSYYPTQSSQHRSDFGASPLRRAIAPSAFSEDRCISSSFSQSLHRLRLGQSLRSSSGLSSVPHRFSATRPPVFDATSFLETFVSPGFCVAQIPRSADDEILSHPVCATYSYSSRAVNPSAQWLAVGDDEGRITLLNTLPWQDISAEHTSSNPQWQASSTSAVFELAWRFDDRSILSGASDFSIRSWDTEYQKCTAMFQGHRGSPRTIVYDPTTNGDGGCGMVFASAARDGTIRIWDARTSSRHVVVGDDGEEDCIGIRPVLTIDAAHSAGPASTATSSGKGRKFTRNGAASVVSRPATKRLKRQPLPAGITALSYLPDGEGHKLLSGGSANGIIKCWDLRHVRQSQPSAAVLQVDTQAALREPIMSTWDTPDVSLLAPSSRFARAHGISQIIASSTSLYASCTGGKIYSLPLSTFLDSHLNPSEVQTLYDPVQCQNTLFSRMALFDDRFLAVACNTGNVALWDVSISRDPKEQSAPVRGPEIDSEEETRAAQSMDMGFAKRSQQPGMAILAEGHAKNAEVNAVAWANGPNGPTLSSCGDDAMIRTWHADRVARDGITQAAQE